MNQWLWLVAVIVSLALLFFLWHAVPRWRFQRAMRRPFPAAWQRHLERLPVYHRLGVDLRAELQAKVQAFIYQKRFVGCEGLQVTDAMRVTIAAEACMLLLNRPSTLYRELRWIYIYPTEFRSKMPETDANGVVSTPGGSLLGVSWSNGRVVLAWDSVEHGQRHPGDGHNVVLHEFAHQLDQEDGAADGAPLLYTRDAYRVWSRVLGQEFEQLRTAVAAGEYSLIDEYGATDPAEFFAVVTELFYERPHAMQRHHPELYATLQNYFRVDPRHWHAGEAA